MKNWTKRGTDRDVRPPRSTTVRKHHFTCGLYLNFHLNQNSVNSANHEIVRTISVADPDFPRRGAPIAKGVR